MCERDWKGEDVRVCVCVCGVYVKKEMIICEFLLLISILMETTIIKKNEFKRGNIYFSF